MRLVLVNPNTSAAATADMLSLAQAEAGSGVDIVGLTAAYGASTILDEDMLARAAGAVTSMAGTIECLAPDGVIVAAFGNPGAEALRARLPVPVVGIGEAAMLEAGREGRFAVVTTTPGLAHAIERDAARLGLSDRFLGVKLTEGDPLQVMAESDGLSEALAAACARAVEAGAGAIAIGGGPLAKCAALMRERIQVPIIEPVSAGVRFLCRSAPKHAFR
jgi:allantoin racemase